MTAFNVCFIQQAGPSRFLCAADGCDRFPDNDATIFCDRCNSQHPEPKIKGGLSADYWRTLIKNTREQEARMGWADRRTKITTTAAPKENQNRQWLGVPGGTTSGVEAPTLTEAMNKGGQPVTSSAFKVPSIEALQAEIQLLKDTANKLAQENITLMKSRDYWRTEYEDANVRLRTTIAENSRIAGVVAEGIRSIADALENAGVV